MPLTLAACAATPELGRRHEPSGVDLPVPGQDFEEYVTEARGQIAAALRVAGPPPELGLIEDRGPFELVPDDEACPRPADGVWPDAALLVHPIGGTPYAMRDLGARLAEDCVLVRAILLPGHGTVPGDLLEVDAAAWLEAVRRGVTGFAGVAGRVHLVGASTGTTLVLHHARLGEPVPDVAHGALVLISPVIEPPARSGAGGPLAWLTHGFGTGSGWARVDDDLDPVAYGSLPEHAFSEVRRLAREVGAEPSAMEQPVFAAASASDVAVDAGAVRRWFCRRLSGPRWLVWYTPDPAPVTDCRFVETRPSATSPGILDYAHVALPIAPDNARYGEAGDPSCRHYARTEDSPVWLLCADRTLTPENSTVRYGEITPANLERAIVRRLTYNPDFDRLADAMLAFIETAGSLPWPPPPRPEPDA